MSFRSRFTAVVLVLLMLCLVYYQGLQGVNLQEQPEMIQGTLTEKDTIHVWYTDEALTDYMNSCALNYMETHEEIRVVPTHVSAVEYLESIHKATMENEVYPDVYLISNDCLEKAYMSGLATEITDPDHMVTDAYYSETALNAVTYQDKKVAYPFYYETALFLYNRSYLEAMAQSKAEEKTVQAEDLIPKTFDDILAIADEYDAPEGLESILKWDVSDIFYNYFFAGNYMDIGGETGDDSSVLNIYNEQSVACMQMYQSLNQFFSIEADATDYEMVLDEFIKGKTLFTVVTTDAIAKMEQAIADGTFTWEYGVTTIPNISSNLKSRGLSVTNTVVVNGYGKHREDANKFASYLTGGVDASLYERTGKLAAKKDVAYTNAKLDQAMQSYADSASLPKIMQASNFWVQLEVAYTQIWQGEDADSKMKQLEEQMRKQLQ